MKKILPYILLIGILIVFFPEIVLVGAMIFSLIWEWVSELWYIIFLPIVIILFGSLLRKIKLPNIIYSIGCLGIIIGFLGIFSVLIYMLFLKENNSETYTKLFYSFLGIIIIGAIINYPLLSNENIDEEAKERMQKKIKEIQEKQKEETN